MPDQTCPRCGDNGRFLTNAPTTTRQYFGCDRCGGVFVLDAVDLKMKRRVVGRFSQRKQRRPRQSRLDANRFDSSNR
jgi:ribosomal protein S27AE